MGRPAGSVVVSICPTFAPSGMVKSIFLCKHPANIQHYTETSFGLHRRTDAAAARASFSCFASCTSASAAQIAPTCSAVKSCRIRPVKSTSESRSGTQHSSRGCHKSCLQLSLWSPLSPKKRPSRGDRHHRTSSAATGTGLQNDEPSGQTITVAFGDVCCPSHVCKERRALLVASG